MEKEKEYKEIHLLDAQISKLTNNYIDEHCEDLSYSTFITHNHAHNKRMYFVPIPQVPRSPQSVTVSLLQLF